MNIKRTLNDIILVLKSVNEYEWAKMFTYFLERSEVLESIELNKEILKIYGGMGSFNDLVLYNDGQLCYEENIELDKLRKRLFSLITDR